MVTRKTINQINIFSRDKLMTVNIKALFYIETRIDQLALGIVQPC